MSVVVRSKWLLTRYGVPIAAVLAIAGVLALGGAFGAYTDHPTESVTEPVYEQRVATETTTSAVVTGESPLYERGTTLRDKPVYFLNATPDLTLRTVTALPEGERVRTTQRLVLVHRAARDGEVFWSSRRVLAATEESTANGSVVTETTVDMARVQRTVAEKRSEIGGIGTFRTAVRLRVTYETANYSGSLNASSPVVLTDRAYWLDGQLSDDRTHRETTTRTVTREPDVARVIALALVGVLTLALAGTVWSTASRGFDLDEIETELARTRYDEWISRGDLPTKAEKDYISIDTLEDLVDIAIDSNKRVIYDESYGAYGVVDADIVYYYADGEVEFEQWLDV